MFDFVYASCDSPEPLHSYVIANKNTGQYLGSCGYADYDDSIVEAYYSINKPYRGKTIAIEAIKALAGRLSSVSEVCAYCHPENKTAHAVAINSGFLSKGMAMYKNFGIEGLLFVFQRNE
ncbi:GNAT family N-acetyltransferase [Chloroflexota bacterium]